MGKKSHKKGRENQPNNPARIETSTTNEPKTHPQEAEVLEVVVIPAGIQLVEVARVYADTILQHYHTLGVKVQVSVFEYYELENPDIEATIERKVNALAGQLGSKQAELHALGGLGAFVAYRILQIAPQTVKRTFFIGGAPADTLTKQARLFCERDINVLCWLHRKKFLRLSANYPNPSKSLLVQEINQSATMIIREHPELYRNQMKLVGAWNIDPLWHAGENRAFYIPSTINQIGMKHAEMYDYVDAVSRWYKHGVTILERPSQDFSSDTLLPMNELLAQINKGRNLEKEAG